MAAKIVEIFSEGGFAMPAVELPKLVPDQIALILKRGDDWIVCGPEYRAAEWKRVSHEPLLVWRALKHIRICDATPFSHRNMLFLRYREEMFAILLAAADPVEPLAQSDYGRCLESRVVEFEPSGELPHDVANAAVQSCMKLGLVYTNRQVELLERLEAIEKEQLAGRVVEIRACRKNKAACAK